jgi:hypothetical protein
MAGVKNIHNNGKLRFSQSEMQIQALVLDVTLLGQKDQISK